MRFREGPLALHAANQARPRQRLSLQVAPLTIGLLSAPLWAGLVGPRL